MNYMKIVPIMPYCFRSHYNWRRKTALKVHPLHFHYVRYVNYERNIFLHVNFAIA